MIIVISIVIVIVVVIVAPYCPKDGSLPGERVRMCHWLSAAFLPHLHMLLFLTDAAVLTWPSAD